MKYGILTKLSNDKNALRTNEMEGEFELPVVGQQFVIINDKPLTNLGSNRMIYTSIVKKVEFSRDLLSDHLIYKFKTENSEYMVEVYGEVLEAQEI